jgi:hypothetical protein
MTKQLLRTFVSAALVCGVAAPAGAQSHDQWEVEIAPLYFWAASTSGTLDAVGKTLPVSMDFAQAKDKLAGAFTFHGEGRRGRVGALADINFIRLSTDTSYQLPAGMTASGTLDFNTTVFEAGMTFLVAKPFSLIGGVRTYTMSTDITITRPLATNSGSASRTAADGFVGFVYRPSLTSDRKVVLLTRADVGTGQAKFEWKANAGLEYRYRPWGGVMAGYGGFGFQKDKDATTPVGTIEIGSYDITQYGPVFAMLFHWGK